MGWDSGMLACGLALACLSASAQVAPPAASAADRAMAQAMFEQAKLEVAEFPDYLQGDYLQFIAFEESALDDGADAAAPSIAVQDAKRAFYQAVALQGPSGSSPAVVLDLKREVETDAVILLGNEVVFKRMAFDALEQVADGADIRHGGIYDDLIRTFSGPGALWSHTCADPLALARRSEAFDGSFPFQGLDQLMQTMARYRQMPAQFPVPQAGDGGCLLPPAVVKTLFLEAYRAHDPLDANQSGLLNLLYHAHGYVPELDAETSARLLTLFNGETNAGIAEEELARIAEINPGLAAEAAAGRGMTIPNLPQPPAPLAPDARQHVMELLGHDPAAAVQAALAITDPAQRFAALTDAALNLARAQPSLAREAAASALAEACTASVPNPQACTFRDANLAEALRRLGEDEPASMLALACLQAAAKAARAKELAWQGVPPGKRFEQAPHFTGKFQDATTLFLLASDADFNQAARFALALPDGMFRPLALAAVAGEFEGR